MYNQNLNIFFLVTANTDLVILCSRTSTPPCTPIRQFIYFFLDISRTWINGIKVKTTNKKYYKVMSVPDLDLEYIKIQYFERSTRYKVFLLSRWLNSWHSRTVYNPWLKGKKSVGDCEKIMNIFCKNYFFLLFQFFYRSCQENPVQQVTLPTIGLISRF